MKRFAIGFSVVFLFVLAIAYIGAGYFFSTVLIEGQTQSTPSFNANQASGWLPGWQSDAVEQVDIESGDVTLSATFFMNEAAGDCAVMLLHGYTSHRYTMLPYATPFWEAGCHIMLYDARGHGRSDDALHTYGYFEREDANAVFEWVMARADLPAGSIGLIGQSYGGATVLQLLDVRNDMAFIIADAPYQDLVSITKTQGAAQYGESIINLFAPVAFQMVELRAGVEVDDISPALTVMDTTVPILLVHARGDNFTPSTQSEAIYAASNKTTTTLVLTDWSDQHGQRFHGNEAGYRQIIDDFIAGAAPAFLPLP